MFGLEKLFKKKGAAPPSEERISLEEAVLRYQAKLRKAEEEKEADYARLRPEMERALSGVREAFKGLRNAVVPEPRATSSQQIKDSYADRMLEIIEGTYLGDDLESSAAALEGFLEHVKVGPREAAHMKFFFEMELAEIAVRLRAVALLFAELQKLAGHGKDNAISSFTDIDTKAEEIRERRQAKLEELDEISNKLRNENAKALPDLAEEKNRLADVLRDMRAAEADIERAFGPLARMLAEKAESLPEKELRAAARAYSAQPVQAFLEDSDGSIFGVLQHLSGDPRVQAAIARKGDLLSAKGRLKDLLPRKASLEHAISAKEGLHAAHLADVALLEKRLSESRKDLERLEASAEEIAENRKEAIAKLQRALREMGEEVVIAQV
jgi:hypothetical protein